MRYVAAAMLAALAGQEVNAKNIEKILSSVGIEADAEKVSKVVAELAGKNLEELTAEGKKKISSVPSGGGGAPAAAAPAAAAAGGAAAPAAKKVEEEEEEEDDDMGFGLFD
ncbi:60S acidic ribosomal protein P2 [Eurytemora carolleeae]|uniref:60S acidic ribosomal protein P2 n=1 Tax=Eurytemora carolleeae TaxID=1294199 RepID=UPI000C78EB11|nr:60S acidic ribosomal protein P2 [Eurytemora carolleeae]|eukprot:XP_023339803.1 60S acidic ribosomal protein P2-like [Eurytemora affinis]